MTCSSTKGYEGTAAATGTQGIEVESSAEGAELGHKMEASRKRGYPMDGL